MATTQYHHHMGSRALKVNKHKVARTRVVNYVYLPTVGAMAGRSHVCMLLIAPTKVGPLES